MPDFIEKLYIATQNYAERKTSLKNINNSGFCLEFSGLCSTAEKNNDLQHISKALGAPTEEDIRQKKKKSWWSYFFFNDYFAN